MIPSSATPFLKRLSKLSSVSSGCSSTFMRAELQRSCSRRHGGPSAVARSSASSAPAYLAPASSRLEAVAAIHGPVLAWLEWHLGLFPAGRADCRVQLPTFRASLASSSTAPSAPPFGAAGWAPAGCVLQPLGGVEFLLSRGPDETIPAIAAGHGLVREAHLCPPLLETMTSTVSANCRGMDP
jgi:hypothetical protein